jgi:1-pyrroline-5-carboxylate dehydrogenase
MCEEIFGPVLSFYVYDADKFEETLHLVDETSPYALTGAILSGTGLQLNWLLKNW